MRQREQRIKVSLDCQRAVGHRSGVSAGVQCGETGVGSMAHWRALCLGQRWHGPVGRFSFFVLPEW